MKQKKKHVVTSPNVVIRGMVKSSMSNQPSLVKCVKNRTIPNNMKDGNVMDNIVMKKYSGRSLMGRIR